MSQEFIDKYLEETEEIIKNLDRAEIAKFIDILFGAWKNNKKVITMGNGGSASTASHIAGDLLKTVVNDSSMKDIGQTKGFRALCLNDNQPALTAWINDSGWDKAYSGMLHTLLDEGDVILLVSVHGGSGWSGNLVHAMEMAKKKKAKIIGLAGFDGGKMKEMCDSCIVVPKDSTPHTEGFHGVLQHLVIFRVKEMIEEGLKTRKDRMQFFADTANYDEIDYCFSRKVNDGITTNPKIMENYGVSDFLNACESTLIRYNNVQVSLETDLRGLEVKRLEENPQIVNEVLLRQAHILARLGENVVVKIPICSGGLITVKKLSSEGVKTNVTACITPFQAVTAAEAGATYVSLFSNRMLDSHILELSGYSPNEILTNPEWKAIVRENKEKYFEQAWTRTLSQIAYVAKKCEAIGCKLIIGSIRSPEDIIRIVSSKPQVITIPTKIVEGLEKIEELKDRRREVSGEDAIIGNSITHPMTTYTLNEFEKAADSYRAIKAKTF